MAICHYSRTHLHALQIGINHGSKNPFTNVLSDDELKALKADDLIKKITSLTSFEHRVLYYGTKTQEQLKESINKLHNVPEKLSPLP